MGRIDRGWAGSVKDGQGQCRMGRVAVAARAPAGPRGSGCARAPPPGHPRLCRDGRRPCPPVCSRALHVSPLYSSPLVSPPMFPPCVPPGIRVPGGSWLAHCGVPPAAGVIPRGPQRSVGTRCCPGDAASVPPSFLEGNRKPPSEGVCPGKNHTGGASLHLCARAESLGRDVRALRVNSRTPLTQISLVLRPGLTMEISAIDIWKSPSGASGAARRYTSSLEGTSPAGRSQRLSRCKQCGHRQRLGDGYKKGGGGEAAGAAERELPAPACPALPGAAAPSGCGQSPRWALSGQRLRDRPGCADRGSPGEPRLLLPFLRTRTRCRRGTCRGAELGRSIRSVPRPPRPSPRRPRRRCRRSFLAGPARTPPAPRPAATPLRHLPGCPWLAVRPEGSAAFPPSSSATEVSGAPSPVLRGCPGARRPPPRASHHLQPAASASATAGAAHRPGPLPSERCPCGSRATEGAATEGCGQNSVCVNPAASRSRTAGTAAPGPSRTGLCIPAGPERRWGSGGLSLDGGTARLQAGALPQPLAAGLNPFLAPQPRQDGAGSPGTLGRPQPHTGDAAAAAAGPPGLQRHRPPALQAVLGAGRDQLSRAEDKQEYHRSGTGLAIAQRDFLTQDGTCFTVSAFSGWIKGVPHSGFKVEMSKGIILHLVDEVTSWLPGDLALSLTAQIILCIRLKSLISFLAQGKKAAYFVFTLEKS
ncbi:uncharacterized protein LOC106629227 [Zonotrichia albicollis]|uniref:uncharacterized protein LOC106629227 n=1 Tax=Zonotrichia albicollis TaxID=44394 RepID=UPI003D811FC8